MAAVPQKKRSEKTAKKRVANAEEELRPRHPSGIGRPDGVVRHY